MTLRVVASAALSITVTVAVHAQAPAPVTHDALITAAKRAAGADHAGTFLRICVAPDNLNAGGPRAGGPGPRVVPDRGTWYAKPYKVFDNLYFIGTRIHSAWALTSGAISTDILELPRASSRHSGGKGRLRESDADPGRGSARLLVRPRGPLLPRRLQTHGPGSLWSEGGQCWSRGRVD